MDEFEDFLNKLTKPEVADLKHQYALGEQLCRAKNKATLSWWWLAMPLYLIAAFVMKGIYKPTATFSDSIKEFSRKEWYVSPLLFLVVPAILIIINGTSIINVYRVTRGGKTTSFISTVLMQLVIVILSLITLTLFIIK